MGAKKTDQQNIEYSFKDMYLEMPPDDRKIALEKQADGIEIIDVRYDLSVDEIRDYNIQIGEISSEIEKIERKIKKLTELHLQPLREEVRGMKKNRSPLIKANAKGFEMINNVRCYRVTDPEAGLYGMTYYFNEDGKLVEERRATSDELDNRSIFSKLKKV